MDGAPGSFYEAILQGLAGDVTGRRMLFVFVVDHSTPMVRPLGRTGRSRLEVVREGLDEMIGEMAQVDRRHLDLGLIGYGVEDSESGVDTMWASPDPGSRDLVRSLTQIQVPTGNGYVASKPPASSADDHILKALDVAGEVVAAWSDRNPDPIFTPVLIHVRSDDRPENPGLSAAAERLKALADPFLFHCCLTDECADSVVFPRSTEVTGGLGRQLYDFSSEMPPLMVDIGELLKGRVTPRLREAAEDVAAAHGLPGWLGSIAANGLGELLRPGGISLPTGRYGWIRRVGVSVEGLSIHSSRGFAWVRDAIGFRIFTRLCN